MSRPMTTGERRRIRDLAQAGLSNRAIGRQVGRNWNCVKRHIGEDLCRAQRHAARVREAERLERLFRACNAALTRQAMP